jgi:hypothetical protein
VIKVSSEETSKKSQEPEISLEIPYLKDPELLEELKKRIEEFEKSGIQDRVLKGGDGYVPRIKKRDYIIAIIINLAITIYFLIAVLTGP